MRPALRDQLIALHESLATVRFVDAESRQLLLLLLADISRLLDPDSSAEQDNSPVDKLESLAVKFDADHPALSAALRQLMDALAKAGI